MSVLKNKLNFFLLEPLKEWKSDKSFIDKITSPLTHRLLFVLILLGLFVAMPFLALDAGTSADEVLHYNQSKKNYDYFATDGDNKECLKPIGVDPLYAYGQSFDTVSYAIMKWCGVEKIYHVRHFFIAILGWMIILFSGLLAARISGYRAAVWTALLVFFTPSFIGHAWNNPKDIPFATAYIATFYFLVRWLQDYPKIKWFNSIALTLSIAFAISIRIGGLLLLAHTGLFFFLTWLMNAKGQLFGKESMNNLLKYAGVGILIAGASFFIGISIWPFALESPFENPKKALDLMTNINIRLHQLFDGETYWSNELPTIYIYKIMFLTIPAMVFIGFLFFLLTITYNKSKKFFLLMMFFACAFPLAYVTYKHSVLYGGWRHMLFVFPSFAVLAGIGFSVVLDQFKKSNIRLLVSVLLLLLFIHPVKHTLANHPYEYVYYNEIQGGVKGAEGDFETDYYQHSVQEASEWLAKYIAEKDHPKKGERRLVCHYTKKELMDYYFQKDTSMVTFVYSRYYERSMKDWDYCIVFAGYISSYELKSKSWPSKDALYVVSVDGVPICSVEKRGSKEDFLGYKALQQNNFVEAKTHLGNYVSQYPNRAEALYLYGISLFNTGQQQEGINQLYKSLEVYDKYEVAYGALGNMYQQLGKFDEAVKIYHQYIDVKDNSPEAYYGLAQTYVRMNKLDNASQVLINLLNTVDARYGPGYDLLYQVLMKQGKINEANQVMAARQKNAK